MKIDVQTEYSGLTEKVFGVYVEAARVCIDRHHESPQTLTISDKGKKFQAELCWKASSSVERASHANSVDATEFGACCICLMAVFRTRGLVAVARAETGTGADFYLGEAGASVEDLENCIRLEVSGIDVGSSSVLAKRLEAKKKQAARGKSNLPALASVVSFSALEVAIEDVQP